ncbi:hypothetical protein RJ44_19950 [Alteromonas macleodii]|uniref:hypothetical protein n=1 Tax=Alteromonas macleodii TaxID=28108 RepID=UPI00057ED26E|nr:hypothetical protein [Alteromonas macleodii]KHT53273.1 hypothetical protein RJ44_19950 [Alteromonas macleodii]
MEPFEMNLTSAKQKVDEYFQKSTWLGTVVSGFVVAIISAFFIEVNPTANFSAVISFTIGLLLAVCFMYDCMDSSFKPMTMPLGFLSLAYLLIGAFHLINHDQQIVEPYIEMFGTICFVLAWVFVSKNSPRQKDRRAEILPIVVISFTLVAFTLWRGSIQGDAVNEQNDQALRLMVNTCNCLIVLSLYSVLRRNFKSPDTVTNLSILLFGAAQLAAPGRDCLTVKEHTFLTKCSLDNAELFASAVSANSIAWMLFLGKIMFGFYLLNLYFDKSNAKNN